MRSSCLLFVLLAVASTCVLGIKEESGAVKFIPLGDARMKIATIAHSTRTLMNSFQTHDYANALNFIDQHTQILTHSLLPTSGYYQGKRGLIQYGDRSSRLATITDANYRILFVDEVRGYSVVEVHKKGVFRHNNVSFDDCQSVLFIQWSLGKIAKLNIVESNPEQIYSLFLTKANKQWNKLMSTMYTCGACEEVNKYIADDVIVTFKNVYPISLFAGKQGQEVEDKNVGKDLNVVLKGRDNLKKFAAFANKTYFNMTADIKVLYSDENTVVAAKILKPTTHLFLPSNKKIYWKNVTIMYTINRFNDKGEVNNVVVMFNRPFQAHEIRWIGQMFLELSGESLSSLLAPLQAAINLTPAVAAAS